MILRKQCFIGKEDCSLLHYHRNDASDSRMCSCHDVGGITRVKRTEIKCNLLLNRLERIGIDWNIFLTVIILLTLLQGSPIVYFEIQGTNFLLTCKFCRYLFREAETVDV